MKLFKSRKLSIVLALVLVLTSFSFTAMAETTVAEDVSIIGSAGSLDITNISGVSDEYKIVVDKEYEDPILGETVVKFSATKYGAPSGNWNTAGSEPKRRFDQLLAKADYSNDKFTNLTIDFDIYIANATDGVAFRMERFSTDTNALVEKTYHYVGVGGAEFTAGTATYEYINKDLKVGEWNDVVIELGANTNNKDVVFHVNGVSTICETKLPDNTYGFGGANQNRATFVPKGNKGMPFEIRLNNFSVKATNKVHDFNIHNSNYFTTDSFISRSPAKATCTEENALEFSADYNKKAVRIENVSGSGLSGSAGSEVGFQLYPGASSSTNASLGGVDWSKYKNLRIQFNAYLGYENVVYLRTVRSVNGTFDSTNNNHSIGVGTPADPEGSDTKTVNPGSGSTNCTYKYMEMTPGMWHNVVMELGANKNNKYINIYIDGNIVALENNVTEFANADTAEGFGTVGSNRCLLVFRDTADSFFNGQISDISFTACNSMYTPTAAPTINGVVRAQDSTGGLSYRVDTENKKITYVDGRDTDGMSVADFKVSDVDYVGPADNNTKVIAYNDTSKRVTYYTLSEQTDVVLDGLQAEIGEDGRLYVQYDYTNPNKDEVSKFKLFIACFKDEALVYIGGDKWYEHPYGLSAVSHDLSLPTRTEYDTIKVFAWGSTGGENPVTIIPVLKMAEVVK